MLNIDKSVLDKRVFKKEQYARNVDQLLLGQTKNWLRKDKITIDVGAAAGIMSTYFCENSKFVHSFEAVPPVYDQLIKLKNKFQNIACYKAAVSHTSGLTSFYVDDKRLSNSGLQNLVGGVRIEVPMIDLDSFEFNNVGFLKVDTEGTELDVLMGAYNIIKNNYPTCMVECYYKYNKYPIDTTYNFFKNFNYQCSYNIKNVGLKKIENVNEFIDISSNESLIDVHDGDFLFHI